MPINNKYCYWYQSKKPNYLDFQDFNTSQEKVTRIFIRCEKMFAVSCIYYSHNVNLIIRLLAIADIFRKHSKQCHRRILISSLKISPIFTRSFLNIPMNNTVRLNPQGTFKIIARLYFPRCYVSNGDLAKLQSISEIVYC